MELLEWCPVPRVILINKQGNVQYVLRNIDHSPVSCLALNPNSTNIKNALMATHVDGTL